MNSVASTLNRVTDMEFNNQISVLTQNNWNTWKHDMQVLLMHYGCWQFIIQTKPERPDEEEATYKEKLDLQLHKDRSAWKILKDHFEPVAKARIIQLLDHFFGTKYQLGEDVGTFISCVKTAATRLQEAGHKLDDLYIGFQLIRWLPQEFQSTVQQIYRWKEEDFRVVKIEAELILEANRLQLMKQDLEKAENAYLSSFTSKKSKTLPGATAAAHGDPNGKNDYQKKGDLKPITNMKMSLATEDKSCPVEGIGTLRFRVKYKGSFHEITLSDVLFNPKLRRNLLSGSRLESKGAHFVGTKGRKPSVLHLIPFGCLAYAGVPKQIRKKFDMHAKMGVMMGYAQCTKGYRIWLIDENKLVETINVRFDENKRGINFRQKVNSNLGYNLNLPDYYDEDDFDRVKDSLTSHLVSKTSTETPSRSEKPDVSSDNHSLIPCTEVKWIRNIGRKVTGSNVYYSIKGEATRLKSFNEIERYCKRHNIEYDPSFFNFRKDNTESQGFSDLSEQQEALMVEVTIPNCYKQAIRSRDASKWHDAMDKEINVMMERKVWDLVDHPDNIKILENRWVYTIKYDENNKIVRYKARLVARDTVIYMKQPTGYEIDNNKVCKLRKAIYGLHQSGRQWFWN
ncbi:retrovirus-related Pol polyprotein from transposon RE1 [Trichonephila clavipes]|uniref:Retrovirus-related Pol polyprotein from transposon RE1 n=1 Tax=Trichonephila clavipes TaxID=2585209 RepID=A0A8X6VNE7_TRICX|nr:retrovirus-related Pol polyprotein from transposon RE1 [Trichonephila clavipes]